LIQLLFWDASISVMTTLILFLMLLQI
jgi:hypothetical protein